jgi:hypothetical protein
MFSLFLSSRNRIMKISNEIRGILYLKLFLKRFKINKESFLKNIIIFHHLSQNKKKFHLNEHQFEALAMY